MNPLETQPEWDALKKSPKRKLINSRQVRRAALELAEKRKMGSGQPRFFRVSGKFLDRANFVLEQWMRAQVNAAPSKGRTL